MIPVHWAKANDDLMMMQTPFQAMELDEVVSLVPAQNQSLNIAQRQSRISKIK